MSTAARLLAGSWVITLAIWRWSEPEFRVAAFAATDLALTGAFFLMSRGRWFPVPLFLLHAALIFYHAYALVADPGIIWVAAFLNRTFEIELVYVFACSVYRLTRLSQKRNRAQDGARGSAVDRAALRVSRTASPSDDAGDFSNGPDDRRPRR
ncbi:MAG: hypothetical protein WD076_05590 [Parvularculaceae bacterium]